MIKTCYCIGIAILMAACHGPELQTPGQPSGARHAFTQKNPTEARRAFAKTLAKALANQKLREFIKAQALEQFDEDYDVLFHAQKNKKVSGDTTFFDLLASYHGSTQDFVDVTQSVPKLTILVPELLNEKFYNSAKTWDTEHFVPKVAAFESGSKQLTVDAYDSQGKSYPFPTKRDPDELILVIKENERIEVINGSQGASTVPPDEKASWEYFMTDGDTHYYFSSPNFNRTKSAKRKQLRVKSIGTDFNVGPNSPEYRSHQYRPEAPRGYAYYKTYYRDGSLVTNTSELFAGQLDYTMKDRICFLRFSNDEKIKSISEDWSDGNFELIGRVLVGGRVSEAFTNIGFGSVSLTKLAAKLTVPGFAEAVEGGYGEICVPVGPRCIRFNPWLDAFRDYQSSTTLFDNRGSAVNSGVWISWNGGTELLTWDAEAYGNRIMLIVKEKDDGATHTDEHTWSVGLTATVGKKDGSNLTFSGSSSGKTTVTWRNDDDDLFQQIIDYNGQYGAFRPAVNAGDTEFVLRVY